MKLNFVGGTGRARSLALNAQRTVNLYPVADDGGKEPTAFYGTPGLKLFATAGSGAVRECFFSTKKRAFAVSGNKLFEIDAVGGVTERGTLEQSSGNLTMVENRTQLAICDGLSLYIFTYANNSFNKVTDSDLPAIGTVETIDSYLAVNELNTDKMFISKVADGTSWNALDFASAESNPDGLLRVLNGLGQLWLFGARTTELWSNEGDSQFPFRRVSGGVMQVGIEAPYSAVATKDAVFWVGRDENGGGIVYAATGFTPDRISTEAIEIVIQNAVNVQDILGYVYQQDGHFFYVLTGGGLETTLVYDVTLGVWHERAYLNDDGQYEQHLGACHMYAFGRHLVGDRLSGNIYELDLKEYRDNGRLIKRERTFQHISDENRTITINNLEIDIEAGVGTQEGEGQDPKIILEASTDKGKTFDYEEEDSMGMAGDFEKEVSFSGLGSAKHWTFRLTTTEPVKIVWIGAYTK